MGRCLIVWRFVDSLSRMECRVSLTGYSLRRAMSCLSNRSRSRLLNLGLHLLSLPVIHPPDKPRYQANRSPRQHQPSSNYQHVQSA